MAKSNILETLRQALRGQGVDLENLNNEMLSDLDNAAQNVVMGTLGDEPPQRVGVRLEAFFERMNADQLKAVALRFNPAAKAARVVDNRKAITQSLNSPELLSAMIAKLPELERTALDFVARHGDAANGWNIISHLAGLGFSAPKQLPGGSSMSFYGSRLMDSDAVRLIGTLLRDCLLIPHSSQASWFGRGYYYQQSPSTPEDDLLYLDPHVQQVLQKTAKPNTRTRVPLELPSVEAALSAPHPARVLLELSEVMNLVLASPGVTLTRDGWVSKPVLTRFAKLRPWLGGRSGFYLEALIGLGCLRPDQSETTLKPDVAAWSSFQTLALEAQYTQVLECYIQTLDHPQYTNLYDGVTNRHAARRGLVSSLALLPPHAVAIDVALNALFERSLHFFCSSSRESMWGRKPVTPALPEFFKRELLGSLHDLGLIALEAKKDGRPSAAIRIGPGIAWLNGKRELVNSSALLVQPNFDVLVYLDALNPLALAALSGADCQRIDAQTATYTISRASVYRALETGLSATTLLEMLEMFSGAPLPRNLVSSVGEWAGRRERLSLTEGVTLLEYHDASERNAGVAQLKGATAVGERFALVAHAPKKAAVHNYFSNPTRTIAFQSDGTFKLEGGSDLGARAAIAGIATLVGADTYAFSADAVRSGRFNTATREAFLARVKNKIPASLEALLSIWSGKLAPPSLAPITVFQHEQAAALSTHPSLQAHLNAALSPTAILVKHGAERKLEAALSALGLEVGQALRENIKALDAQSLSPLQMGLDTRKMRGILETAIAQQCDVELQYHSEKTTQTRYGYPEKSRGKVVQEAFKPISVTYSASTPYLNAVTLEGEETRRIRIGYILGLAIA